MIPASSGAGMVPIPTKHEMDLLEKDTKPQGWWMRDRSLLCIQRDNHCFVFMLWSCTTHVQAWRKANPQPQNTDSSNSPTSEGLKAQCWVLAFVVASGTSISSLGAWYAPKQVLF